MVDRLHRGGNLLVDPPFPNGTRNPPVRSQEGLTAQNPLYRHASETGHVGPRIVNPVEPIIRSCSARPSERIVFGERRTRGGRGRSRKYRKKHFPHLYNDCRMIFSGTPSPTSPYLFGSYKDPEEGRRTPADAKRVYHSGYYGIPGEGTAPRILSLLLMSACTIMALFSSILSCLGASYVYLSSILLTIPSLLMMCLAIRKRSFFLISHGKRFNRLLHQYSADLQLVGWLRHHSHTLLREGPGLMILQSLILFICLLTSVYQATRPSSSPVGILSRPLIPLLLLPAARTTMDLLYRSPSRGLAIILSLTLGAMIEFTPTSTGMNSTILLEILGLIGANISGMATLGMVGLHEILDSPLYALLAALCGMLIQTVVLISSGSNLYCAPIRNYSPSVWMRSWSFRSFLALAIYATITVLATTIILSIVGLSPGDPLYVLTRSVTLASLAGSKLRMIIQVSFKTIESAFGLNYTFIFWFLIFMTLFSPISGVRATTDLCDTVNDNPFSC